MSQDKDFVAPSKLQVIIPYSDFERMIKVLDEVEEIKKQFSRLDDQYAAIKYMFSECLEVVRDIKKFVQD